MDPGRLATMSLKSINPATGQVIAEYTEHSVEDVERRLQVAEAAHSAHLDRSHEERGRWLFRAAELLESRRDELGRLMTLEMGKTLAAAAAEVEKCAWVCRHYAEQGPRLLADEPVDTDAFRSFVRYQSLGVVLAVMPWNFPFWQVFRFAAPAIMAGNAGLLKHASNVPGCALEIERILADAGVPEGLFLTLLIGANQAERLIADPRIRAVTLTGSEPAGRAVARVAGDQVKKTVLELGGSDPFVVMPSADLDAAVATAVRARVINNGQSCIAAKRFIVHEAVAEAFREGFLAGMAALVVGDPLHADTDVGPLATGAIRDELHEQVLESVAAGARLLLGGKRPEGRGFFYPPTVLEDAPAGCPAYEEELFGPVAALFRVGSLEEAVGLANDTPFGLGAAAWTRDESEAEHLADRLEAGCVAINGMVASDPRLPFGGVKRSGYGRELGAFGIREFCNIKAVRVEA